MNPKQPFLITLFATLFIFSSVIYVSCSKSDNKDPDPCQSVTCLNGGTCTNGACVCPSGYEGPNCANSWSLKFAGVWNVKEGIDGFPPVLATGTINTSTTNNNVILISYTAIAVFTNAVCDLTSSHAFTIRDFSPAPGAEIKNGIGTIDELGIKITGSYVIQVDTTAITVNFLMDKI